MARRSIRPTYPRDWMSISRRVKAAHKRLLEEGRLSRGAGLASSEELFCRDPEDFNGNIHIRMRF